MSCLPKERISQQRFSKIPFKKRALVWDHKKYVFATTISRHFVTFWFFQTVLNRKGPFSCDNCGLKFPNRKSFRTHNVKHRKVVFTCDLCPQSFLFKFDLTNHVEGKHLKLLPFACNICPYKHYSRMSLKSHMKKHGPKAECKICHKFISNMHQHMQYHVNVECKICRCITLKANMKTHMKTHLKANKNKC